MNPGRKLGVRLSAGRNGMTSGRRAFVPAP